MAAAADVRRAVLNLLVTPHADTRFSQWYVPREIAEQTSCQSHQVYEALWGLVGEGLVYLDPAGQGSGTDNWRWRLSENGVAAATGGSWEPRDVDGYLRRLRSHRPEVDPVAVNYVAEALRAFNARCYLATSVMLGVASESVINGLGRAIVAVRGDQAKKLADFLDSTTSRASRQFVEMRKQLELMDLPEVAVSTEFGPTVTVRSGPTRGLAGRQRASVFEGDALVRSTAGCCVWRRGIAPTRQHSDRP